MMLFFESSTANSNWLPYMKRRIEYHAKQHIAELMVHDYAQITRENYRDSRTLTKLLQNITDFQLHQLAYKPHPLVFSSIFPHNATLEVKRGAKSSPLHENVIVKGCPGKESILYSPNLRLVVH